MRNKRVNVWVAALLISGFATLAWQRVEASTPQSTLNTMTSITTLAGHSDMQYIVLAYESRLRGNRPVQPGEMQDQPAVESAQADAVTLCDSVGVQAGTTPENWDGGPIDVPCDPGDSGIEGETAASTGPASEADSPH